MSFRVETLTGYFATDADGVEGLVGMTTPDGKWMPFVAADHNRAMQLRPLAAEIAKITKTRIVIAQFSVRTDLEEIVP